MGRITSSDPALNPYGVPYRRVLELREEAAARKEAKMSEAVRKLLAVETARANGRPPKIIRALRDEALKAAKIALL